MGLLDGIRRRGIRRPGVRFGRGRRDTGRVPAPFVVGIARSGTTLLRLMLDAHPQLTIPPETHFLPRLFTHFDRWVEQGIEGAELRERAIGADRQPPALGRHRSRSPRGRAPDGGSRSAERGRRRPVVLRGICRSGGQAPLGRQVPSLHMEGEADPACPARGALHPSDPRRPRRRPVAEQGELGAGRSSRRRRPSGSRSWEMLGAGRSGCAPVPTSRSGTRTWSPSPSRSCGGSPTSSACRGTAGCSNTIAAPTSG